MFTQESWNALYRKRTLDRLADLLEPELTAALAVPTCRSLRAKGPASRKAAESTAERSRRFTDRVLVDMVHGRAYHKGREIDLEAWKRGKLVTR